MNETRTIPETSKRAADWLRKVADLVEQKGISYGDSIGNPVRIFSQVDVMTGIDVRIDDKLSRIKNKTSWEGDRDLEDLAGYVALKATAKT